MKLQLSIESKEEEARKFEKRREDILAGKMVVTGKSSEVPAALEPTVVAIPPPAPLASTTQKAKNKLHRSRQNVSIVWDHFNGGHWNPEKVPSIFGTRQTLYFLY